MGLLDLGLDDGTGKKASKGHVTWGPTIYFTENDKQNRKAIPTKYENLCTTCWCELPKNLASSMTRSTRTCEEEDCFVKALFNCKECDQDLCQVCDMKFHRRGKR